MNKEYEYSFEVTTTNPFIDYCINNNYELENKYEQIRTLYKNGGQIMARITKNIYKDNQVEVIDFKDDNLSDDNLKISRETKKLIITDENKEFVNSLLEILELKETKKLIRERVIYKKNNVIFEIDEYKTPNMKVIAIEGIKEEVDDVYKKLEKIIESKRILTIKKN